MGSIYRRTERFCRTCEGKRLARTADRKACEAAGHQIETRESPIWWAKYSRNGKSYAESTGTDKIGKAKDHLRRIEGKIADGIAVTPKMNRITFDEAVTDIENDYKANGRKSLDHLQRRIKLHLEPVFAGRRMANITTVEVRAFIAARLEAGASKAEINRELAVLKRMFVLATQAGKLTARPHIPMLREQNARSGFFEREQFDGLSKHLPEPLQRVVGFAYITGWRVPSEVLTLEWRQVDFAAGEVRLDPGMTKNGEPRVFPMTRDLRRVLDAAKVDHDQLKAAGTIVPRVFHRNGKPIKRFGKAWKAACVSAGCPGRIPHDFRRTAVRNLVRAGVPERVAMTMTGHLTRSVFERYNIVSSSDLRDAAARLDGTFAATK